MGRENQIDRFRRESIQVDEAQRRIIKHIRSRDKELIGLEEAFGRRLATDMKAAHNMPHFRRSGMDGYAIDSESTSGAARPARRKEIPKGDGKFRPLGIPAKRDSVVQMVMKMVIEPILR